MKPYKRPDSPYWWIGYREPTGNPNKPFRYRYKSSGTTVEREAEKVLAEVEELLASGARVAAGPKTFAGYAETWAKERGGRRDDEKVWGSEHELGLLKFHVFSELGHMRLADVRPNNIRALVKTLKTKRHSKTKEKPAGTEYSPRSIRNIVAVVRSLFEDAVADELIEVSPCILKSGDMPAIADADPEWRDEAEFTRNEVRLLISSALLPWNRRIWWALGFFTGMRTGEIAALRWRHLRTKETPLARLDVVGSYNAVHKRVKSTKTRRPRHVPVHPTLFALLEEWRSEGWAEMNGRKPEPDDLIVTNERGGFLSDVNTKKTRPRDLRKLGLRVRRFHDARSTFITLGTTDGAEEIWLERVTHNAKGTVVNQYRRKNWLKMCEAVTCLQLEPAVLRSPLRSGGDAMEDRDTTTEASSAVGGTRTPRHAERRTLEDVNPGASVDEDAEPTAEKDGQRRNVGRSPGLGKRAQAVAKRYAARGRR